MQEMEQDANLIEKESDPDESWWLKMLKNQDI